MTPLNAARWPIGPGGSPRFRQVRDAAILLCRFSMEFNRTPGNRGISNVVVT